MLERVEVGNSGRVSSLFVGLLVKKPEYWPCSFSLHLSSESKLHRKKVPLFLSHSQCCQAVQTCCCENRDFSSQWKKHSKVCFMVWVQLWLMKVCFVGIEIASSSLETVFGSWDMCYNVVQSTWAACDWPVQNSQRVVLHYFVRRKFTASPNKSDKWSLEDTSMLWRDMNVKYAFWQKNTHEKQQSNVHVVWSLHTQTLNLRGNPQIHSLKACSDNIRCP